MEFKELYEKYKWGQVTEEEKEFVEKELAKYDDMRQCLGDGKEECGDEKEVANEPEMLKNGDKQLLKQTCMITVIGIVIVLAVFGIIYGVKIHPAIEQAEKYKAEKAAVEDETFPYKGWDINTISSNTNSSDAQLGYERFYNLHMMGESAPKFQCHGALDKEKGQYYYTITDEDGRETSGITINGVMTTGIPNIDMPFELEGVEDTLDRDIEELEERKGYRVYISFEEYLDEEGIARLLEKDKQNDYLRWIGISTSLDNSGYPLIGLYTLDYFEQISIDDLKSYINHQLDFMIDHPEVVNFLGKSELIGAKYYETVKKELQQNEYKSFGVTIVGEKAQIKTLCKGLKGCITYSEELYSY